jgi:hypothetical protein
MSSTLLITHSHSHKEEREYIFRVLFHEFLGVSYVSRETFGEEVQIQLVDAPEQGFLILPDVLFQKQVDDWLNIASLPKQPLSMWDVARYLPEAKVIKSPIHVIYGKPLGVGTWFNQNGKSIQLGLDIFGSAFFMLTRCEEMVLPDRDEHGRFPAKASLAFKEGFLERPIVDEYVEILWACMKHLWPSLKRKQRSYQIFLSHDIDNPVVAANKPWRLVIRNVAGDLVKRHDVHYAIRRLAAKCFRNYDSDPYYTFDFIMDVSERYRLKSVFYFKAGSTDSPFDDNYTLEMTFVRKLMLNIRQRGHEIGLHPSYEAYKDVEQLRAEFRLLLDTADKLNIEQKGWGGRQHYLRWENPNTWQNWEEIGLNYDATLSFADHVGFRCGTCHEFPVFNLRTRRTLRLRERPLIAMDATLLEQQYMALEPEQVLGRIERLSNAVRCYDGAFSLLWHNSNLAQSWQKQFYLRVIDVLAK